MGSESEDSSTSSEYGAIRCGWIHSSKVDGLDDAPRDRPAVAAKESHLETTIGGRVGEGRTSKNSIRIIRRGIRRLRSRGE